jgi:hypothetical protein
VSQIKCARCMAVAPTLTAMSAHMAQAHYFPCRKCTSVFVSADRLAAHDSGNHPAEVETSTTPTSQGKQGSHRMQLMVQLAKEAPNAPPKLVSSLAVSSRTFLVQPQGFKALVSTCCFNLIHCCENQSANEWVASSQECHQQSGASHKDCPKFQLGGVRRQFCICCSW